MKTKEKLKKLKREAGNKTNKVTYCEIKKRY